MLKSACEAPINAKNSKFQTEVVLKIERVLETTNSILRMVVALYSVGHLAPKTKIKRVHTRELPIGYNMTVEASMNLKHS